MKNRIMRQRTPGPVPPAAHNGGRPGCPSGRRAADRADVRSDQRWRVCHRRGLAEPAGSAGSGRLGARDCGRHGRRIRSRPRVTRRTHARRAFGEAGITPGDIDLAEVHDSTAFNELLAYEELGLCAPGEGARFALSGRSRIGGTVPVNTSGGLESRGHPVAATGLAQICELVWQLRQDAGDRQVPDARIAVAENAGGYVVDDTAAAVVTVLSAERPG